MSAPGSACQKCGAPGMAWVTHVCPPPMSSQPIENVPMKVTLDAGLWGQIVFRVRESDDFYLRQLVEQAATGGQMHV